jgi:hypothetical protein
MVDLVTGKITERTPDFGKDRAAVELGRKGGLKAGKTSAASLSSAQRSASARKAARARWSKNPGKW